MKKSLSTKLPMEERRRSNERHNKSATQFIQNKR
jgi:hypothetical protein